MLRITGPSIGSFVDVTFVQDGKDIATLETINGRKALLTNDSFAAPGDRCRVTIVGEDEGKTLYFVKVDRVIWKSSNGVALQLGVRGIVDVTQGASNCLDMQWAVFKGFRMYLDDAPGYYLELLLDTLEYYSMVPQAQRPVVDYLAICDAIEQILPLVHGSDVNARRDCCTRAYRYLLEIGTCELGAVQMLGLGMEQI